MHLGQPKSMRLKLQAPMLILSIIAQICLKELRNKAEKLSLVSAAWLAMRALRVMTNQTKKRKRTLSNS